jgi:hypothetical protein
MTTSIYRQTLFAGKIVGAYTAEEEEEIHRWLGGARAGKMPRAVLHATKDFGHAPFHQSAPRHHPMPKKAAF